MNAMLPVPMGECHVLLGGRVCLANSSGVTRINPHGRRLVLIHIVGTPRVRCWVDIEYAHLTRAAALAALRNSIGIAS